MWLLVFIYWDRVYFPGMRSEALEEHSPQSGASKMSVGDLPEKRSPPGVRVFNNWGGETRREWASCPPVGLRRNLQVDASSAALGGSAQDGLGSHRGSAIPSWNHLFY